MSGIVIFVGPTLPRSAIELPATVRGPARCGDILRSSGEGFDTIALIDGYFEHCPPVWHKEILWALARGIRVYGASSMGALRAAELSPFGMRGVGRVFEAYRDGLLEDDDEVALAHGDESDHYRPRSEPLVNIRVTLHRATLDHVFERSTAEQLLQLARQRFYPERSFAALISDASTIPGLSRAAHALREWLGPRLHKRVDQKAEDARELIQVLKEQPTQVEGEGHPFSFAHTECFSELLRRYPVKP